MQELGPLWDETTSSAWHKVFSLLRGITESVYSMKQQQQQLGTTA